ncbi:MAG: hypothetical protein HY746_05605, partial [Elusimicrobia bacterium]|nr:hypothetical protein [Elusimicrobiota bacterium]
MTKPEYIYGMNSVAEMLRRGKRKIAKILVSKNESARANEIFRIARH